MAFTKITNEDRVGKGNVGQPDTPLLTATEMQEQMDSLPNLAIDKFNAFLDEIADISASSNIGCTAPVGVETTSTTLYGVLSAIAAIANASTALAHSHANKEALDTLTANFIEELANLVTMFTGIDRVSMSTMYNDPDAIPTSRAVINYLTGENLATPIMNAIFPIGAIYQTTTTDPDTLFDTSGKWTLLSTDSSGIKTYKRTA